MEEEFIVYIIRKNQLPDDEDEFTDFLKDSGVEGWLQVILKISKQELVQRPHLMVSSLQRFVQQLKQYSEFQTFSAIVGKKN